MQERDPAAANRVAVSQTLQSNGLVPRPSLAGIADSIWPGQSVE
jgi:hypothetical protein